MERNVPTPRDVSGAQHCDEAIERAVTRVEELGDSPIAHHVEAFEEAHRILQEHLTEAADG